MANLSYLGGFALTVTILYNLDIPRYKFTLLRLFNILPYIYLYFEQTTRLAACVGPLPTENTGEILRSMLYFHMWGKFAGILLFRGNKRKHINLFFSF